jgi:hypothetical protein
MASTNLMASLFCFMLICIRDGKGWNIHAMNRGGNCPKFSNLNSKFINIRKSMPVSTTRLRMSNDDYVISQEIIDAEAKSTPLRQSISAL